MGGKSRISTVDIKAMKGKDPIVCLTAYTHPFAHILDKHVDLLLVGDSLGMVLYGMDSTLAVTVDMMIAHGKAVVKGSQKACVVVDMPFGSYQESKEQAFSNAAKIMAQTGCQAVKLEGGAEMEETVNFLTSRCIPVVGHVGLMPQSVNVYGGYRYQGRNAVAGQKIIDDSVAIERAGAFAVVIEGVDSSVAEDVTKKLAIPVIGIGASVLCDGQVLVTEDMAGLFETTPRFVKRFGKLAENIEQAAADYSLHVRQRSFPADEHCLKQLKSVPDINIVNK